MSKLRKHVGHARHCCSAFTPCLSVVRRWGGHFLGCAMFIRLALGCLLCIACFCCLTEAAIQLPTLRATLNRSTVVEFVIQVSNRRFVSAAQIQKCAPFVYVCMRASARCLQVSLKLQSVQLALHIHGTMLFCITKSAGPPAHSCYVAWPLVPRRVINGECVLCTAGSQAGYKWGMCYHATQASRWGAMRLSASQFVPGRP